MKLVGLAFTLGGWLLAVAGLLLTSSTGARIAIACLGIAASLYGSLGVLNGYYLEQIGRASCRERV